MTRPTNSSSFSFLAARWGFSGRGRRVSALPVWLWIAVAGWALPLAGQPQGRPTQAAPTAQSPAREVNRGAAAATTAATGLPASASELTDQQVFSLLTLEERRSWGEAQTLLREAATQKANGEWLLSRQLSTMENPEVARPRLEASHRRGREEVAAANAKTQRANSVLLALRESAFTRLIESSRPPVPPIKIEVTLPLTDPDWGRLYTEQSRILRQQGYNRLFFAGHFLPVATMVSEDASVPVEGVAVEGLAVQGGPAGQSLQRGDHREVWEAFRSADRGSFLLQSGSPRDLEVGWVRNELTFSFPQAEESRRHFIAAVLFARTYPLSAGLELRVVDAFELSTVRLLHRTMALVPRSSLGLEKQEVPTRAGQASGEIEQPGTRDAGNTPLDAAAAVGAAQPTITSAPSVAGSPGPLSARVVVKPLPYELKVTLTDSQRILGTMTSPDLAERYLWQFSAREDGDPISVVGELVLEGELTKQGLRFLPEGFFRSVYPESLRGEEVRQSNAKLALLEPEELATLTVATQNPAGAVGAGASEAGADSFPEVVSRRRDFLVVATVSEPAAAPPVVIETVSIRLGLAEGGVEVPK